MKFLIFLAAAVTIFDGTSGKKLRLIADLNGGLVTGVNPGLVMAGLNPAFLTGGAGFIGQPQLAQMVPGVPPYYMQPAAVPASPYGFPNAGNQQPQQQPFPFQPPNGGFPYYVGFPQAQPGLLPPQQQVVGGNTQQQQQNPGVPVMRFKRMLRRLQRINVGKTNEDSIPTETTPSPTAL